jgi:protein TonB
MFHYRLTLANRHARLLIAAFLAIMLHAALLSFNVDRRLTDAQQATIPRSVAVFLGRQSVQMVPVMMQQEVQKAEGIATGGASRDARHEKQVNDLPPAVSAKRERPTRYAAVPNRETKVIEPLDKKNRTTDKNALAPPLPAESFETGATGDSGTADREKPAAPIPAFAEEAGTNQAGTLSLAYPRYRLNAPPLYPGLARKRGQEGTVILRVLVNSAGRVDGLEVEKSSGVGSLDRAAESAVRKWSFEPGRRGKEKVDMWVRVPVTFKLD